MLPHARSCSPIVPIETAASLHPTRCASRSSRALGLLCDFPRNIRLLLRVVAGCWSGPRAEHPIRAFRQARRSDLFWNQLQYTLDLTVTQHEAALASAHLSLHPVPVSARFRQQMSSPEPLVGGSECAERKCGCIRYSPFRSICFPLASVWVGMHPTSTTGSFPRVLCILKAPSWVTQNSYLPVVWSALLQSVTELSSPPSPAKMRGKDERTKQSYSLGVAHRLR